MMNRHSARRRGSRIPIAPVLLSATLLAGLLSCENPQGEVKGNSAPETRLSNVPADDTIAQYLDQGAIPEQTLYWSGDDPDGFVIAFRYSWTTFHGSTTIPKDTVTLLNLASIGGFSLDTLIVVPEATARRPGSLFRIYNFLAIMDEDEVETREALFDSLVTLRTFAVPYLSGTIPGDSIRGTDPLFNEAPTKGIFIFDSPADSNLHRFQVWAVDNKEVIDPTPATVHFWTLPSPFLVVSIVGSPPLPPLGIPPPYVLRFPTERSPGLTFTFTALDPSTDQRDYSWSVDDTVSWSAWSDDAFAVVTASDFKETGSDTHKFYVRGRNRWGVISATVSRLRTPQGGDTGDYFVASIPPIDTVGHPQRTLVINNSRIVDNTTWMPAVDAGDVSDFYVEVLDSIGKQEGADYDIWVTSENGYTFPDRGVLAEYTSVLLLAEQEISSLPFGELTRITQANQGLLYEYFNIGGKLIFSGPPYVIYCFGTTPAAWDVMGNDIFHFLTSESLPQIDPPLNTAFDLVGGTGILGYPNVRIDTTKLPPEAEGALPNIAVNFPRGFGQTIFEFDSKTDTTSYLNVLTNQELLFSGSPVGIRYLAPPPIPPARATYSAVYFGFPLYYMEKSGVIATLRKAFEDIGE